MNIVTAEKRNGITKSKALRRSGMVPCVICGSTLSESLPIQMEMMIANRMFKEKREGSTIQIKVDEQIIPVQIKEKTWDFLKNELVHINFQALTANQKVNSITHIILQNTDKVTGILEKVLLEIPYSAFPDNMIDTIAVDLDGLPVGASLTVGEISQFQNDKIELQVSLDSLVFKINEKKHLSALEEE